MTESSFKTTTGFDALVGCRRDDARNSRLAVPSSSERLEAKKPSG
jgi:hypothetical protein